MFPSLRCCSARAHTPLIKFIGKRVWPSQLEERLPHPAAPAELKGRFAEFLAKMNFSPAKSSSGKGSSDVNVYREFWEAPTRFWRPRIRQLTDAEMDSIMSGGASSY